MKAYIPTVDSSSDMIQSLKEGLILAGVTPVLYRAVTPDEPTDLAGHKAAILATYVKLLEKIEGEDERVLVIQEDAVFNQAQLIEWVNLDLYKSGIIDLYAQVAAFHFCPVAFDIGSREATTFLSVIEARGVLCDAFRDVRTPGPDVFWSGREPRSE